jgi:adenosine deaminase
VVARLDRSISREQYEAEFIAPQKCASLADYLRHAPRGFQLMQTREALHLVTKDLFEQLVKDNVIYAEIRFAPLLHTTGGLSPHEVVEIIDRTVEDCIRASGLEARVILCCLRHFTREESLATARLVQVFRGSRVVAMDLAGDEAGYPVGAHVAAFRYAMEHGLRRTAHAGEALGAASVRETLKAFQPSRIGHGVRSIEDAQLIEELRREKIHLEVCPSSNVQTDVCLEYGVHPIDRLFRAGVSVGVNTDSRTITNVTLSEEYSRLSRHFGWKLDEFSACNREALRAAFVEESVKERLAVRLAAMTN